MRWRGRKESSNIEDIRSQGRGMGGGRRNTGFGRSGRGVRIPGGGMRRASGGGFGTIILLVIAFFALRACGIDPMAILAGGGGQQPQIAPQTTRNQAPRTGGASDEMRQFVGVVLKETEDVWNGIFQQEGRDYPEPKLVMFTDAVRSACGSASSATGPFYCPGDSKIYLDIRFFDTLALSFDAAGDFAQAYVIAHEVGHHVQNVVGVLPKFNRMRRQMSEADANAMSVRVELQADCFAGIWAYYTDQKGLLEEGDIEEALNAARQVGDDTIQRRTQGYVVPESFSHGTSEQRRNWFNRGYQSGRLDQCDTKIFG